MLHPSTSFTEDGVPLFLEDRGKSKTFGEKQRKSRKGLRGNHLVVDGGAIQKPFHSDEEISDSEASETNEDSDATLSGGEETEEKTDIRGTVSKIVRRKAMDDDVEDALNDAIGEDEEDNVNESTLDTEENGVRGLMPAWKDDEDERLEVDLTSRNRLRKLRKDFQDTIVSGKEFESRLRTLYALYL